MVGSDQRHGEENGSTQMVCAINCGGTVIGLDYNGGNGSYATRPVVSIPRAEVDIVVTGTGTTATLSL